MRSIIAVLLLLSALSSSAADRGMYDEEISKHLATLRSLMIRAQKVKPKDEVQSFAIRQGLFELSKALHRLEEEALSTNLELMKQGNPSDRQLLLVSSISKTADLAQVLTSNYVETRDKVFWSSASTAADLARSMLTAE